MRFKGDVCLEQPGGGVSGAGSLKAGTWEISTN